MIMFSSAKNSHFILLYIFTSNYQTVVRTELKWGKVYAEQLIKNNKDWQQLSFSQGKSEMKTFENEIKQILSNVIL